jgi:hypothetical protein
MLSLAGIFAADCGLDNVKMLVLSQNKGKNKREMTKRFIFWAFFPLESV